NAMWSLSKNPSSFRASRRLGFATALPDCDLVWAISAESTRPSALVSPVKYATGTIRSPARLCSVMEQRDAFGTPVKLTIVSLPDVDALAIVPHGVVTELKLTGTPDLTTIW